MKIALLPGGFKPPHLGHYNMAKYLADFADKVIIRIGQKEREGIGKELALEIWNYYKEFDPDSRSGKLVISIAQSPSPVRDVYDFVEQTAPEGSTVILGLGEKDASDGRYNSIPKFAEPRNIKAEIELVPPQAGGISGTRMREIIKSNNKEEFFKFIPDYLPEEIKEEIWTKLLDSQMPSEVSEGISDYIPVIGKIKTLAKTLHSTKHLPQGPSKNRTPEEEKEYRDILDNKRDAFRHILASAYFTTKMGGFLTKNTGEALELMGALKSKLKGGPFDSGWDMDSANNQLGVELGRKNPDSSFNDFVSLTQKSIQSGNFYTSDGTTLHKNLDEMMGGTMNKQEMDKHNANMKKLSKHLAKVNSQGDMVPVPTKLTKGLRRKLYEKVGIQRGTVESEVQFLSREIFELFKENLGKKYHTGGFEGWLEGSEFIAEFEITDLTFIPRDAYKMNGEPYSIAADTDDEDIEIIIDYNPTVFPEEFNNFIAELKETLRHEIEHIIQFNFMPGAAEFIKNWKDGDSWIEYLTRPQEIPAFVKGLKKRAKTKKISLIDAIDEFIEEYIDNFEGPEEIEQVKQIWINWAKENLPRAQYQEEINEMKLFSKEWWLDIITEEILGEGGAAGHMAHPFNLPNVNTGKDLIKSFVVAADSLKKEPGAVKIDGVNASIRLLNNAGKREFAMDRGSKKALDLRGVTKADLEDRFGPGHGMIKAGSNVLDIFNDALSSTEEELNALGLLNDPNIMFNMEYVSGKSNVQDYGKNFLALHGLLSVETKEVQGARKMLTKRVTTEKNFDQADMDEYLKKLEPFANKRGFEIYGSVPTTFTKDPDFKSVLGTNYTIDFAEGDKTKSLAQWLNDVTNIPKEDRLKMNVNGTTKDVGALSKQVYFAVFGGENVDDLFDNEQDIQKAIQGATTYLATEKLGDAILDVLDSPMGSVNDHEGVVIRDPKVSPKPYKITGKFITGGVSSQFQSK